MQFLCFVNTKSRGHVHIHTPLGQQGYFSHTKKKSSYLLRHLTQLARLCPCMKYSKSITLTDGANECLWISSLFLFIFMTL